MNKALMFSLADGGLCHYAYCLSDALQNGGVDVTTLMYDHPSYELAALPHRHAPRPDVRMGLTKVQRLINPYRNLRCFLRESRDTDVVHFQCGIGARTDPTLWGTLKAAGKKIVYTAHDVRPHEAERLSRKHTLWLYENADALIVHGRRLRDTLLEMAPDAARKTHVIPLGNFNFVADLFHQWDRARARASFGYGPEEKVVLFFGLIRPYKGLDDLIAACRLLTQEHPGVPLRLLIAGRTLDTYWEDGGYARQIAEAGLTDRTTCVIEHVPMEDVGRYFRASDVVAIPYKSGSQSGILQLAYAFAKPVVVTDVGSIAEVVEPGRTGLVVPPSDPAAFAAALAQLLADPEQAQRVGCQARAYAETVLSWGPIASQTKSLYEALSLRN